MMYYPFLLLQATNIHGGAPDAPRVDSVRPMLWVLEMTGATVESDGG